MSDTQHTTAPTDLLSCRSSHMRKFLHVDSPSSMTKIYKSAGIEGQGTRGRERVLTPSESRRILENRKYDLNGSAKKIVFWVNKGGVGKSTISKLVATFIATLGFKVLFVDADSQGNSTDAFNLEKKGITIDDETPVLYDILTGSVGVQDCIIKVDENLHIMPSTLNNQNISDQQLRKYENNPSRFYKKLLEPIENDYDYIITDCGPNLGLLNCSIASDADMTLVLAHPHKFSKKGVAVTFETISELEESFNISIPRRILFNRYAKKNNITHKVLSEIMAEYEDYMLPVIIGEKQEIAHAIEYDHNIFLETKFRELGIDGKMKTIEYKESPDEIVSLTQSILELPELSRITEKQLQ